MTDTSYTVHAIAGIPEVGPGDDVAALISAAVTESGLGLRAGDILCVTSKILSKAEGRVVRADDREAAIDAEMVRLVARRGPTRIVQTRHGFVMAAAGVDASNTPAGTVLLLPEDPDGSARDIADALRDRFGVAVGVVVTDTFGRPWREGQTDVAIGCAYVNALMDHRGTIDAFGNELLVTAAAAVDELAGAGEVVKGKADGVPVALIRGLGTLVTEEPGLGVRPLIRAAENDMFSLGTQEAMREAATRRRTTEWFASDPVPGDVVRRAVAAALTAPSPSPEGPAPWRFVLVESETARKTFAGALADSVLERAPYLVVPCRIAIAFPDPEFLTASLGAAVENFLVTLAADGIGSKWTTADPGVVRTLLALPKEWEPLGVIAIGKPAEAPTAQTPRDPEDYIAVR
ncbi:coenzyme F420-0:L-glutamate ligase [Catenulispora pinisilvae]|uniref:coenzyme F420-0:L-glutamate ligase n=1 Tax=Catenulispora pinisilvae TaxID=2705253 RepID=UPI0018914A96|nr:coenzyme F420-0:L-glutamate ligase [Catenulispora pinisilvae]